MRRSSLVLLGVILAPTTLHAQTVTFGAARWLRDPHITEYRLGLGGFGIGPLRLVYSAQYLKQADTSKAHWYGAGADLILRTTASARPYIIGGAAAGAGRGFTGGGEEPGVGLWGGVGAELVTLGPLGLQAEALYNWRSGVQLHGFALGLRIGTKFGRSVDKPLTAPTSTIPNDVALPKANPADENTLRSLSTTAPTSPTVMAAEIVSTAVSVMGTPYKWGGTDTEGFDCSGLIRYAYAQHGITLPRRSIDQAKTGSEVGRERGNLMPGDILTFSENPGGDVSHVGLYLGDGRFIHSARGGVQISLLTADDPVGKWWFDRWVGARRLL